jgi:hypothetical protein
VTGPTWEVEFTDQFGDWWVNLIEGEQEAIVAWLVHRAGSGMAAPVDLIKPPRQRDDPPGVVLFAFDPGGW